VDVWNGQVLEPMSELFVKKIWLVIVIVSVWKLIFILGSFTKMQFSVTCR
jgi:hypothetical protein